MMKEMFVNMRVWTKAHLVVIMFALLAGMLSVLPHLLAQHALGADYKGIPFLYLNNEDLYLARIHEITDGHLFIGSPHLFEYKDQIPLLPPIGEYFYVVLSFIFGASLPQTLILAKFLFPAVLFLLVYMLVSALTARGGNQHEVRWGAIAAALAVTLGCELLDYHTLYLRLTGNEHSAILSMWTRPVNPITGALLLFAFLNLFWRGIERNSWKYIVGAGGVLGCSIGYIFSFALGFTLLGVCFLFALWRKNNEMAGNIFWVGVVGLILPLLYWLHLVPQLLRGGSGLAERNGAILMHTPLPNKILIASCVVFAFLFVFAKRKDNFQLTKEYQRHLPVWFSIALLLDGLIVLNEQIITGFTIWPYHFVQYTIPLAIVAIFIALFFFLRPHAPQIWRSFIGASIILTIAFAGWNATTYANQLEDFRVLQNFAPVFTWLNDNAPKDCTVVTIEDWVERFGGFVPAFTGCNVYFSGYANNANNIPYTRIEHNFFVKLRLLGITDESVANYLANNQDAIKGYFFKDWRDIFDHKDNTRFAAMVPELAEKYRVFMKKDFETALKEYRVDYIISPEKLSDETRKALPHLREVYTSGQMSIYDFNSSQP